MPWCSLHLHALAGPSALFHVRELRTQSRYRRDGQILLDTQGEISYTSTHKKRLLITDCIYVKQVSF
jgi:hypothetical protein